MKAEVAEESARQFEAAMKSKPIRKRFLQYLGTEAKGIVQAMLACRHGGVAVFLPLTLGL